MARSWKSIVDQLVGGVSRLSFGEPVTHVYNPLEYARVPFDRYLSRWGKGRKEVLLLGMNPGPWGMAQTGIPFGEVALARDFLGVAGKVEQPLFLHPKRPIEGFDCSRSEVSGARLWGWVQERFGSPEAFFERFFIANYCPLVFMEASARNRTPDKLPAAERQALFTVCDEALVAMVERLRPQRVIGVGKFAEGRAREALAGLNLTIGTIPHPSPANPAANRGWAALAEAALVAQGVSLPRA
ncbi:MAG: single-stranded DNA-binding protein [Planctomycetes bacterium]|nr:single-stranded DNA-binding protein [Planctomycetota bacterium]